MSNCEQGFLIQLIHAEPGRRGKCPADQRALPFMLPFQYPQRRLKGFGGRTATTRQAHIKLRNQLLNHHRVSYPRSRPSGADAQTQHKRTVLTGRSQPSMSESVRRLAGHLDQAQARSATLRAPAISQSRQEQALQLGQVRLPDLTQQRLQGGFLTRGHRIDGEHLVHLRMHPQQEQASAKTLSGLVRQPGPVADHVLISLHHHEGQALTVAPIASCIRAEPLGHRDQVHGYGITENATVEQEPPFRSQQVEEGLGLRQVHESAAKIAGGAPHDGYLGQPSFPAMVKDGRILELAREHVRQWFDKRMPRHLRFHDLNHTMEVVRSTLAIAEGSKVVGRDRMLLELAALFHDTGYALAYAGHETKSADLADEFMRRHGMSMRDRAVVRGLILATRTGSRVRTRLQAVIRDADSAKAGQADFQARANRLHAELESQTGKRIAASEWDKANLDYLKGHRFHTAFARKRYGPQKRLNLKSAMARSKSAAEAVVHNAVEHRFIERDISWLAFNDRVLQEAMDARNPLLERVKFLSIYSNNLDEFYRVRVASLQSLGRLKRKERVALGLPVDKLIDRINRKALGQQERFGVLWRGKLLPALARNRIRFRDESNLTTTQERHVRGYFAERIAPLLITANARAGNAPFIEDRKLYFACRVRSRSKPRLRTVLVNIPSQELGRFLVLPSARGSTELMFIDDAVRLCLDQLFTGHDVVHCHAFKLSRDAELYLDEEFGDTVKERVRKSLRKRGSGMPSRLLFDSAMPEASIKDLKNLLGLRKQDLVPGGRYHHFSDMMSLPVTGKPGLREQPWVPVPHPVIGRDRNPFTGLDRRDQLLHFPYHDFGSFTHWLARVIRDRAVKRIHITLYRVAEDSEVCGLLLKALEAGKKVVAFVEVQARFDEGSNLRWGERLEQAGATVLYSHEGLKVHCKLCLVERSVGGRIRRYAYLGTGNFNERTARLYADDALMTADPGITREVALVFDHLRDRRIRPRFKALMVAPAGLRIGLEELIDKEMEQASRGLPASVLLKLNSLEDRAMISKLYEASQAGVEVRLIVRGICCLVPGVAGLSERISAISIVDRYLEHSRAYVFHNQGRPKVYLSSADWMRRNLDHRVEVAFPITDEKCQKEILDMLELQWSDNVKARVINESQNNPYRKAARGQARLRAQDALRNAVKALARRARNPR